MLFEPVMPGREVGECSSLGERFPYSIHIQIQMNNAEKCEQHSLASGCNQLNPVEERYVVSIDGLIGRIVSCSYKKKFEHYYRWNVTK